MLNYALMTKKKPKYAKYNFVFFINKNIQKLNVSNPNYNKVRLDEILTKMLSNINIVHDTI